jgi:hypothetical protein
MILDGEEIEYINTYEISPTTFVLAYPNFAGNLSTVVGIEVFY